MKHSICLFILLTVSVQSVAESKRAYFKKEDSFFSHPTLIIDGKEYRQTFWREEFEIQAAVRSNPQAFKAAQKYTHHKDKASLYLWGGLGLALGYIFTTDRDDFSDTIYWGIFGTGFVMSIYEESQGNKELKSTIQFYNGEF